MPMVSRSDHLWCNLKGDTESSLSWVAQPVASTVRLRVTIAYATTQFVPWPSRCWSPTPMSWPADCSPAVCGATGSCGVFECHLSAAGILKQRFRGPPRHSAGCYHLDRRPAERVGGGARASSQPSRNPRGRVAGEFATRLWWWKRSAWEPKACSAARISSSRRCGSASPR